MAETTIDLSINDVTLTFKDATGTPLTYVAALTEGTLTIQLGDWETFQSTGADGAPIAGGAPRQAGVRQMCGFVLNCSLFDVGDNATDETYQDVRISDGNVGANWVSTTSSPDATIDTWDATIVVADRGSVKGATYTFPDVRREGPPDIEVTRDGGWKVNDTWRSTSTVKATIARTA